MSHGKNSNSQTLVVNNPIVVVDCSFLMMKNCIARQTVNDRMLNVVVSTFNDRALMTMDYVVVNNF
jgi:hypothetical protein